MINLGRQAAIKRLAVSSCAGTWGKASLGLSQFAFGTADIWLGVACAAIAAVFAAAIALRVLRVAPEKALVIAIIAIPLPARLDAPLRAQLIGVFVGFAMLCTRALWWKGNIVCRSKMLPRQHELRELP
jgi:hypothetical protein